MLKKKMGEQIGKHTRETDPIKKIQVGILKNAEILEKCWEVSYWKEKFIRWAQQKIWPDRRKSASFKIEIINLKNRERKRLKKKLRASLVAQWLRIHLPKQGTRVRALVQEGPTCRGETKPLCHNYWACTLEPVSQNYWAHMPRACAPQQEKPPQWEAHTPQRRVAPARHN